MEAEKKSSSAVSDVGAWAMNVISSVGIIMANKQLMSSNGYAFKFGKSILIYARSSNAFILLSPFLAFFPSSRLILEIILCV